MSKSVIIAAAFLVGTVLLVGASAYLGTTGAPGRKSLDLLGCACISASFSVAFYFGNSGNRPEQMEPPRISIAARKDS